MSHAEGGQDTRTTPDQLDQSTPLSRTHGDKPQNGAGAPTATGATHQGYAMGAVSAGAMPPAAAAGVSAAQVMS